MLLLLCALLPGGAVSAGMYSSHDDLQTLYSTETRLVQLLHQHLQAAEAGTPQENAELGNKVPVLGALYTYMVKQRGSGTTAPTYLQHPSNQFSLIYRLVRVWSKLEDIVDYGSALMSYYMDQQYGEKLPEESDITGAAESIHRLQDIYHISGRDIARGVSLRGVKSEELSIGALSVLISISVSKQRWESCVSLGQEGFLHLQSNPEYEFDAQVHWFEIAHRYALCLHNTGKVRLAGEVTEAITTRYRRHLTLTTDDIPLHIAATKPQTETTAPNITYLSKEHPGADKLAMSEEELDKLVEKINVKQYRELCRAQPDLPAEVKKQVDTLHCYLKQNTPRTILKPIKCEDVWHSPLTTIFYDIVSDQENEQILSLARPRLERSVIERGEGESGGGTVSEERVSKISWIYEGLEEDETQVIRKVNRRLEDATELSLQGAEPLQVNNYGIGGMFNPHFDISVDIAKLRHSDPRFAIRGVRIATAMLYMGDVTEGGATVFIDAGARILPVKNAAVFWYNTLPNGLPDMTTQHAGCPVLVGNKWVANKWFDSTDQCFTRPCDREQWSRDTAARLYNGRYSVYEGRGKKKQVPEGPGGYRF